MDKIFKGLHKENNSNFGVKKKYLLNIKWIKNN
jgi:hypothetical protein